MTALKSHPKLRIGEGAIIRANSVVAKDIPAYCIAVGDPCDVVKKRFDDELIEYLLELKWWDWPAEKIFADLKTLTDADLPKIRQKIADKQNGRMPSYRNIPPFLST